MVTYESWLVLTRWPIRRRFSHLTSAVADFNQKFNESLRSRCSDDEGENQRENQREGGPAVGELKADWDKVLVLATSKQPLRCTVRQSVAGGVSNDVTDGKDQQPCVGESSDSAISSAGNLQLRVKMELEHERRLRTQQALDDAERKYYILQRECEAKAKECQEYGNR